LEKTSTEWAPWYVVPANHNWLRDIVVSTVIVEALEGLNMRYPPEEKGLKSLTIK
jgi:polyphosphate kinase 2 (PPK2 family)